MSSSLYVSVAITIGCESEEYVSVSHRETVIPASRSNDDEVVTQSTVDLVDLGRAVLDRMGRELMVNADTQLVQLRGILEGMVT